MLIRTIAFIFAFATSSLAQNIPYEKYTLDNGLTVILHEDHKLPVVAVNLWFKVGAQNEPKGRSGFAHLFEHLMFMGTQRVPGSDFDNIMEAGGGANNASTSLDRTNYFSAGPAALLPTLLWLEADRLEDIGRTMTKDKLDRQRDIVRNEIRQNVENTPYGRLEEYTNRYTLPEGHPYHWNVYGLHEDLEAATVDDVKGFFATFYVPNNCSMVVAGDFNSDSIKPLIASLFASLPAGSKPPQPMLAALPPARNASTTTITMLDKVELPRIRYAYHTPPTYAEGDADLNLLAAILADGKSSRLYKRLVLDEKLCVDVNAGQDSAVLGSQFFIDLIAAPDSDLGRIEKLADEEIARLTADGPTLAELEQRKATIELGMLARIESIEALADQLNAYQYHFNEPNSFERDLNRYRSVTPDSIKKWAKLLDPDHRFIARVLPDELSSERAPTARDTRPEVLKPTAFTPPAPQSFSLASGLPVLVFTRPELPLVSVELLIPGAAAAAPNDKAGLAYLTAQMLGEGAGDRDAVQFSDAVQTLGATFASRADRRAFTIDLTVLKRNLDPALALFADAIKRPRFSDTDFERVKRLHLEGLEQDLTDPAAVAQRVFLRTLFGDDHPYAMPADGTVASVDGLTLADIKSLYARAIAPAPRATLLISGAITPEEARAALEKALGSWPTDSDAAASAAPPTMPPAPTHNALRVFLIDRPGAVQTVIRFATPAPASTDPARAKLEALNTLLGGSFTSRLNQNLRERNGFTYGAGSGYSLLPGTGYFAARSSVKSDVTGAALKEFLAEFSRLRGGPIGATFVAAPKGDISDAEVIKSVETIRAGTVQAFQGHAGPLAAAADRLAQGLTYDTIAADLTSLGSLTAADLNTMSRDATPLERGVLLLVGDKATILPQLEGLDLPKPVELTVEGEPVKN